MHSGQIQQLSRKPFNPAIHMTKQKDNTELFLNRAIGMSLVMLAATSAVAQNPPAPAAAPPPPPKWTGSASAGLTLTSGNSDTLLFTAKLLASRKWDARNELDLGADATYGENEDLKNNEAIHGFAQYNRLFTDRAFGYLRLDALHDDIADVYYRVTLGPGVGYYFIKNERTFLRGETGPAVVFENQGGEEQTYLTLRLADRFEHKLSETAKIWQSAELLPEVGDWENFIINAEIGIEVAINTRWSLKTYLQDTYDNEPAEDRLKNDLKLVAAIAYKF
jgi:putative salt-induced outer membrane protein YdiY